MKLYDGLLLVVVCGCGPSVDDAGDWPDWEGQRVGFWDADAPNRFHVVDVATGEDRELDTLRPYDLSRWSFAAGDQVVVVQTDAGSYESFDVASGEPLGLVASSDCGSLLGVAADPSGTSVALAGPTDACDAMKLQVHTFVDGSWQSRDVFTSAGEITEFTWAAVAPMLAVIHTPQPDRWVLTRVDVETGETRDLFVASSPLELPRLAPDGSSWAVAEDNIVHLPTWYEQVDNGVQSLEWHPQRAELVALGMNAESWVLYPAAETSAFGSYHPVGTILVGWPPTGDGDPFYRPCVDPDACPRDVASAVWSSRQELLLLDAEEVLLADPNADTLRSLGFGVAPRWAP